VTSRERVMAALNREKPDRAPRGLYGEIVGYVPAVARLLAERCAPKTPRERFEMDATSVAQNATRLPRDRFLDWLPSAVRDRVDAPDSAPENCRLPAEIAVDEWGVCRRRGVFEHFAHIESPLADVDDFDRIKAYPWPDLDRSYRYDGLPGKVAAIHDRGLAVAAFPGSVYEQAWYIRGVQKILEDTMLNAEVAHYLFDHTAHYQKAAAVAFAEAGVDVMILGDDVAMQTGLLMSIEMWREFLGGRLKATIGAVKSARPETKVFYHSDGDVEPLIPDLIEAGVEALNPVQPECMDPAEIKRKYGDRLAFWGTVSLQRTMSRGSPADVREEVRTRVRTVGYDGGLFLSPAHVLPPETPWENIVAFFEAADEPI